MNSMQTNPEKRPHDIAHVMEPPVNAASPDEQAERNKVIARLSAVGVGGNILLAAFKFIAGILGNSMALVSDAVHSTSDVLATAVAYVGDRIARREADENHPYGHERFEQLAAAVLALILASVGIGIGYAGIESLMHGGAGDSSPSVIALVAAAVSIAVKEGMFWATAPAKSIPTCSWRMPGIIAPTPFRRSPRSRALAPPCWASRWAMPSPRLSFACSY